MWSARRALASCCRIDITNFGVDVRCLHEPLGRPVLMGSAPHLSGPKEGDLAESANYRPI